MIKNINGNTPFQYACKLGVLKIIEIGKEHHQPDYYHYRTGCVAASLSPTDSNSE